MFPPFQQYRSSMNASILRYISDIRHSLIKQLPLTENYVPGLPETTIGWNTKFANRNISAFMPVATIGIHGTLEGQYILNRVRSISRGVNVFIKYI